MPNPRAAKSRPSPLLLVSAAGATLAICALVVAPLHAQQRGVGAHVGWTTAGDRQLVVDSLGNRVLRSGQQPRADVPVARTDSNSAQAHRDLLAKRTQGKIDLYFLGNSITRRWGATDYPQLLDNWRQNFFGWNAADFGWGADRIEHMLWRLDHGELDDVHPTVIVVSAGTNNVGSRPGDAEKVEDITRGIRALVARCQAKAPRATIILMGIFPRNDDRANPTAVIPEIDRINANIARMANGTTIRYLNINDKLADADGRLFEGMTMDQLHPTVKGYQLWADALAPILTELLGPRKATDEAPPPTGDPSARRR